MCGHLCVRVCEWERHWKLLTHMLGISSGALNVYSRWRTPPFGQDVMLQEETHEEKKKERRKKNHLQSHIKRDTTLFSVNVHKIKFCMYVRWPGKTSQLRKNLSQKLFCFCFNTNKAVNKANLLFPEHKREKKKSAFRCHTYNNNLINWWKKWKMRNAFLIIGLIGMSLLHWSRFMQRKVHWENNHQFHNLIQELRQQNGGRNTTGADGVASHITQLFIVCTVFSACCYVVSHHRNPHVISHFTNILHIMADLGLAV